jgi:hypothetical protein
MTHKLISTLERDIRNQVVIDRIKKLTRMSRFQILLWRYRVEIIFGLAAGIWTSISVWLIYQVNA